MEPCHLQLEQECSYAMLRESDLIQIPMQYFEAEPVVEAVVGPAAIAAALVVDEAVIGNRVSKAKTVFWSRAI